MSSLRMQHYAIFLQSYDYKISYRNTKDHGNADAMSRLPIEDTSTKIEEIDVVEVNRIETLPITVEELSIATKKDPNVKVLIDGLRNGIEVHSRHRFDITQREFTLQRGCLLRGIRVYVPQSLRERVLNELHSTHFGITRMKSFARSYCWWENIDKDIESIARNCESCELQQNNPTKVPLHCWEPATEPFQRIHVDFAGPLLGIYLLLVVDSYSKWISVYIMQHITTEATIKNIREFFSNFGIPHVLVSDHGTQFTSQEFQQFLKLNGVVHKKGAPYHPATNGQVERYVQTLKNKIKALKCNANNLQKEICNILLTYRKTVHPSTGKSPSTIVFGRQIRSRIDLMIPKEKKVDRDNPEIDKTRTHVVGGRVLVRDYLHRNSKWQLGTIQEKIGKLHYVVKLDDGRTWKRHVDQIRVTQVKSREDTVVTHDIVHDDEFNRDDIVEMPNLETTANDPISPETFNDNNSNTPNVDLNSAITDVDSERVIANDTDSIIRAKPITNPNVNDNNIELRRSKRIIKKPDKLNL